MAKKPLKFVVAARRSVHLNMHNRPETKDKIKKLHLLPGDEVPAGVLPKHQFQDLVRSGAIHIKGEQPETDPEKILRIAEDGELIEAGQSRGKVVSEGDEGSIETEAAPEVDHETGEGAVEPIKARGLWDHDPDVLKGKSLDELNVMIREKDAKAPLAKSIPDAVAQLSQNFIAPAMPPKAATPPPKPAAKPPAKK